MDKRKEVKTAAFDLIKGGFPDSNTVFISMFESMRLKAEDRCLCGVLIGKYYFRLPGVYKYKCKRCRTVVSPLSITPFRRTHVDLLVILKLVCHYYENRKPLSPMEITRLYGCKYSSAVSLNYRIVQWVRLAIGVPGYNESINGHKKIDDKVCWHFANRFNNINTAVASLFESLPPLTTAMKKQ